MGARERLNGGKKRARRNVKNGEKSSSRRSLLFSAPFFSARLVFPLPALSAPGSPRMLSRKTVAKSLADGVVQLAIPGVYDSATVNIFVFIEQRCISFQNDI